MSSQQGGVSHMPGMMSHQGLGQQLVHPAPGGGAQMQGQWRQPLAGQQAPPQRWNELLYWSGKGSKVDIYIRV